MTSPPLIRSIVSRSPVLRRAARRYWIHDVKAGLAQNIAYVVFRRLPTDWVSNLGALFSRFAPHEFPKSDERARRAWARLRPDQASPAQTDAAIRRLWACVGRTMAEILVLDRLWDEGRIEVTGLEALAAIRAAGRPIIVAPLHLGNWETIPLAGVKLGYEGASLALVLPNRFEQRLVGRLRAKFNGRMIHATPTSGRAIVREILERGPMMIYIDDYARGQVHAPSFGRPLRAEGNIAYVVRLAKMTGAAIVPIYSVRQGDQARFRINILPEVQLVDTGEAEADLMANVRQLDDLMEPIIREHLDQWYYLLDLDLDAKPRLSGPRQSSAGRPSV